MIKNLILAATILTTSAFSAEHEHTDISILDGVYGFRQEICQDEKQLKSAQKKVKHLFIQELAKFASIHVQLEIFFSDSPFNEYFAGKLKTLTSQWMFFQGHQGVNVPVLDYDMQDKPAIIGHHYTLIKKIAEIGAIIKKATEKGEGETAEVPDLKTQRQDLQLRADLYALNKYIFYKNLNHQLNQEIKNNTDDTLKTACLYLKNRAGIWKSRVSTHPTSLADQLSLIGTLYNPAFNAVVEKMSFLFFSDLDKTQERIILSKIEGGSTPQDILGRMNKRKQLYGLIRQQLRDVDNVNILDASIIKPIIGLLDHKISKLNQYIAQGEGNYTKQKGLYSRLKEEDQPKEEKPDLAAQYALAKFVSYPAMVYVLTHKSNGETLPELMIMPEALIPYAVYQPSQYNNPIDALFLSITDVMKAKAYKWSERLKKGHKNFLDKHYPKEIYG